MWPVAGCTDETLPVDARSFPEGDRLFHQSPRWLGGDGAFSVALDSERTLWLFGDSFVATSDALMREESTMVRNTVAIQRGGDPTTAEWQAYWREKKEGPGSFFAEEEKAWFWPNHGIRLVEGPLVLFLGRQQAAPGDLGFRSAGTRVVFVENPDDDPDAWRVAHYDPKPIARDPDATIGVAVLRRDDEILAFASAGGDAHLGWLARFHVAHLLVGNAEPQWLRDGAFVSGWELGADEPDVVIDDIAPECSIHFDERWDRYIHVASIGFGATDIALRTAPLPEGPWSDPVRVFTPPESAESGAFVYAAKAHPEIAAGSKRGLLATYATNSFDFEQLVADDSLYYPRFVQLELGSAPSSR